MTWFEYASLLMPSFYPEFISSFYLLSYGLREPWDVRTDVPQFKTFDNKCHKNQSFNINRIYSVAIVSHERT
jgi:hypothetical protein